MHRNGTNNANQGMFQMGIIAVHSIGRCVLIKHTVVVLSVRIKWIKMKVFNICTRKDYEKMGERKSIWYKVGILKEADSGKMYIKLFLHPQTEYFVFEKDENPTGEVNSNN